MNLKKSPLVKIYNPKLFEQKIVEIFDPVYTQRYWYVRATDSNDFDKILTEIVPNYKDKVLIDDDLSLDGECVDLEIDGRLIIAFWFNDHEIGCISHECLHAALFCASGRGVKYHKDHEALCYMYGFLMTEVFSKLNLEIKLNK